LAKSEKYRIEFKNRQGDTCTVQFMYEGYTGSSTYLTPSSRPFILSEYNTDENMFKPYRPQQATINIVASDSSVTMENFMTDNDDDILVIFSFGSFSPYWYGYILQDINCVGISIFAEVETVISHDDVRLLYMVKLYFMFEKLSSITILSLFFSDKT